LGCLPLLPRYIKLTSERASLQASERASRRDNMKKEIEGYAIVLTWRYADGSWNTETLNQDDLADSFLDYLKEYERVENEQASEQKG